MSTYWKVVNEEEDEQDVSLEHIDEKDKDVHVLESVVDSVVTTASIATNTMQLAWLDVVDPTPTLSTTF